MRLDLDKLEKDVGEFEIVVDGNVSKVDVRKVCEIDMENLVKEFTKYPSNVAWYNTVLSLYEAKRIELEESFSRKYAQLDNQCRKDLGEVDRKKDWLFKEKSIESQILVNEECVKLKDEYLLVHKVVKRLAALVKGLDAKGFQLNQVGARARKELELDAMGR